MLLSKKIITVFTALLFICSCNNINNNTKKLNKNVVATTSSEQFVSNNKFQELQNFFVTDLKVNIDSNKSIPFSLIANFVQNDFDTINNISEINPLAYIKNRFGSFFIIKMKCNAGGFCSIIHLLTFDTKGNYKKDEVVGNESGEDTESTYFGLRKINDTLINIYTFKYDNNTGKSYDTIRQNFNLNLR